MNFVTCCDKNIISARSTTDHHKLSDTWVIIVAWVILLTKSQKGLFGNDAVVMIIHQTYCNFSATPVSIHVCRFHIRRPHCRALSDSRCLRLRCSRHIGAPTQSELTSVEILQFTTKPWNMFVYLALAHINTDLQIYINHRVTA